MQLLHVFEIPSISNEKPIKSIKTPSILIEIPVFSLGTLDFDRKTRYCDSEILKY